MGKAQSKSMNVTTADQAKGSVEEGAGKVGKIEETAAAAAVNGDANHETVRNSVFIICHSGSIYYLLWGLMWLCSVTLWNTEDITGNDPWSMPFRSLCGMGPVKGHSAETNEGNLLFN